MTGRDLRREGLELLSRERDGELGVGERARLEELLRQDPSLREASELIRSIDDLLGSTTPTPPVDAVDRIVDSVRAHLAGAGAGADTLRESPRARRGAWPEVAAALTLAAAAVLTVWAVRPGEPSPPPDATDGASPTAAPRVLVPAEAPLPLGGDGAPDADPRTVTVRVEARDARTVSIAGPFNRWKPERTPLRREASGAWTVDLDLPPGRYPYMVVVDGSRWQVDPGATDLVPDGFGGLNGVLEVP